MDEATSPCPSILDGSFRGRKEHQRRQVLGDVEKAMLFPLPYEQDGARTDFSLLVSGLETSPPGDDVVDLIFIVGTLQVLLSGTQPVDSHAKGVRAQELQPALIRSLRHQLAQIEGAHRNL